MSDATRSRWQPAWSGLREASSAFDIATGDLGCRAAHTLTIATHILVMGVGGYGFASCGSDLGFDENNCSSSQARVLMAFATFAVGMITIGFLIPLLKQIMKLEKRDSVEADYSLRSKHPAITGLMILVTLAVLLVDFHMMSKASALDDGRWPHLKAISVVETIAGIITCISLMLYLLKLRRVFGQRDQEREVLAVLDEYADEPEDV